MLKKLLAALALLVAGSAFAAVDVNTASAADLDSIKGIGPATSQAIVKERAKAPFKDWADFVSRVRGVGDKTAAKFSAEGLTVNGAGFAGAAPAAKPAKATQAAAPAAPAAPVAPAAKATIAPIITKAAAPAAPVTGAAVKAAPAKAAEAAAKP